MRQRTLKPEFFDDEQLASVSLLARLTFAGLWCLADRRGRLEDRPARIRARLFPYEPEMPVAQALEELATARLIVRYGAADDPDVRVIWIRTFERHQHVHPREQESTLPAPQSPAATLPGGVAQAVPFQGQPLQGEPFPDKPGNAETSRAGSSGSSDPSSLRSEEDHPPAGPARRPPGGTPEPHPPRPSRLNGAHARAPDESPAVLLLLAHEALDQSPETDADAADLLKTLASRARIAYGNGRTIAAALEQASRQRQVRRREVAS